MKAKCIDLARCPYCKKIIKNVDRTKEFGNLFYCKKCDIEFTKTGLVIS